MDQPPAGGRGRQGQLLRCRSCVVRICCASRVDTGMVCIVHRFKLEEPGNAIVTKIAEGQIFNSPKEREHGQTKVLKPEGAAT